MSFGQRWQDCTLLQFWVLASAGANCKCVCCALAFYFLFWQTFFYFFVFLALRVTVSIWGVPHFGTITFQVATKFHWNPNFLYNNQMRHDLYTLLAVRFYSFFASYSFKVVPSFNFHSVNPFAFLPITISAAVEGLENP